MTIQEHLSHEKVDDDNLSFLKAIGVDYLTVYPGPDVRDGRDRTGYWKEMRKRVESHGLRLYNVAQAGWDEITLGQPDRDEKIEAWCTMVRSIGKAGIPTLGYNFKPLGNFRTRDTIGRGVARYSTFNYEEFVQNPPKVTPKPISEEKLWENLEYFLRRVVPVAEEVGVRMALHPDDPPIAEPLGGTPRIVSTLDQYERIFGMVQSPSNAMLFCQGCVTEMGHHPPDAIRRIGRQNKILYVHFRNIRGNPRNFQEVFVDEGKVDMFQAMQTYKEVGFEGPFMMDHTPVLPHAEANRLGRAFAVGFIRAMIQAVYR
ncbi:MAG: mannonate dehydratase [Planctomycetes bacterium]|nr:mannonate dehydratase [Planctomycetota bacterium]